MSKSTFKCRLLKAMEIRDVKQIELHKKTGDITTDVYTHKTRQQLIDAVNKLPHEVDMDFADDKEKCKPRVSHGRKIS